VVVLVLLAGIGKTGDASAQGRPCAQGTVAHIEIQNNSLFSPDDMRGRPFAWVLRTVNRAHIRTRVDFIRRNLLLSEGGCYDADALAASIRNIRALNFIARAESEAHQLPDSTWRVRVETWDEWSTHTGLNVDVDRTLRFQGFSVTETNTLGRGLSLSLNRHDFREAHDLNLGLSSNRFLGSHANESISGGTTRTGRFFRQDLFQPFLKEASRVSVRVRFQYEDREQAWFTGNTDAISNVVLPLADRSATVSLQHRVGVPGALDVFGGEVQLSRRTVSGPVRQVERGDFDASTPASDSIMAALGAQGAPVSSLRLGGTFGIRRVRFIEAKGLDLVSGVQDVALGTEVIATVGRALDSWGTSPLDTYGHVDGFAGAVTGPVLTNVAVHGEGRYLDAASSTESRWRDLRFSGRALFYVKEPGTTLATFVTGARFDVRDNMNQPSQGSLGGETGVRGYSGDQLPTGSTAVGFVEQRVNLPVIHPAVDVGFTAFGDCGRGWAGQIPFGRNTGWLSSLGAGLRLGFPAGSGSVTRIELAWPVGSRFGSRPVFRAYWSAITTGR
jgi:hypothetical protein